MSEELREVGGVEKLAAAAECLQRVLEKIEAQYESLNAKVERITAAIEEGGIAAVEADAGKGLRQKVENLKRENAELEAKAERLGRKTLSPIVTGLLAKTGVESDVQIDPGVLDKTLEVLTVEQRIAVKAEMARAGLL